uniref:Tudor domain containing 6 n=1 Tax=Leptobrachium leishanense TaxID=445787 RepID=A0A8C5M999_9ANUR
MSHSALVPGSAVTLLVSYVEASSERPLVRLWGSAGHRAEEYRRLREQVQSQAPSCLAASELSRLPAPGEPCLLEVSGSWQRCRLLPTPELRVFLQDLGYSCPATLARLRLAPASLFRLPPHAQCHVLCDLLPLEGTWWSKQALSYLTGLQGQKVDGVIRDIILPQPLVLLEVPSVNKELLQQSLARLVPDYSFREVLRKSLEGNLGPQELGGTMVSSSPPAHPTCRTDYFYPQMQVGVTESVLVTEVTDPQRLYCQLRSLSGEVQRVSDCLNHFYDQQSGYVDPGTPLSFILGQPCAARGTDNRWHRSLLQEYLPDKHLAAVIHVDSGCKDVVPVDSLRPLAPDFFRMPVVTFPCSLYGVSHEGVGWDQAHLFELRSLLYGRPLSAKVEFYNSFSNLYVVTIFGDDGLNLNSLYSARAQTLQIRQVGALPDKNPTPTECHDKADMVEASPKRFHVPKLPTVDLKIGMFHDAMVEHIHDPSNFWVTITKNALKYNEIVESITSLYSTESKLEGIIAEPQTGQLCSARFKDNKYYRAEVVAIHGKRVEVYFIDHGNTECVNWYDVKSLPERFRGVPGAAIYCSMADVSPADGNSWSPAAILAFKVAVVDKKLVIYVLSKESNKYVAEVLDQSRLGERSIGKMLSSAGHAKYEELETVGQVSKLVTAMTVTDGHKQFAGDAASVRSPVKKLVSPAKPEQSQSNFPDYVKHSPFQTQSFEPGTTVEVVVSFVESPGLFWCHVISQFTMLDDLNDRIQKYCENSSHPFDGSTPGCLALSPSDSNWYRALVTKMPQRYSASGTAEVLYVDYGNKEAVPVKDLRAIDGEFLSVKCQAIRCSLYNLIAPLGRDTFCWDKRATSAFNDFIETASGKFSQFYCMIYAVASVEHEMFNVVDLSTPFESVCDLLVNKGFATRLSNKTLSPSVELNSYFYSMHDLKVGSELSVFVTHVTPSLEVYCQLAKNYKTIDKISSIVSQVAKETTVPKSSKNPGPLCLAKFTDQQWYRGFITQCCKNPLVFFVDYGNIDVVLDQDLIPIKPNAYELLLSPMQAVKCSLSDVPPNVPSDIASWFKKYVLSNEYQALIVARDTDGKLEVELYKGSEQINATLKRKLALGDQKTAGHAKTVKGEKNCVRQNNCLDKKGINDLTPEPPAYSLDSEEWVPMSNIPPQPSMGSNNQTSSDVESSCNISLLQHSKLVVPKLSDLPKRTIYQGKFYPVWVNATNSVHDFYLDVAQAWERSLMSVKFCSISGQFGWLEEKDVNVGDLICCNYTDVTNDVVRCRAIVEEKTPGGLQIKYVDLGHTASVSFEEIASLSKELLTFPVMSVHCTLSSFDSASSGLSDDALRHRFIERTSSGWLTCDFVQQRGDTWQVKLLDYRGNVADVLNAKWPGGAASKADPAFKFIWKLPRPGVSVCAKAVVVNDPEDFWCQLTTLNIDDLSTELHEYGEMCAKDEYAISKLEVGYSCNAKSLTDDNWYRAMVTNLDKDQITVRYVDYGDEETVHLDRLRRLPGCLIDVPVQAFPCRLAGFSPLEGSWNSEASTHFSTRLYHDNLSIEAVDFQPYGMCDIVMLSVNVKIGGDLVNEEMKPFWVVGKQTDTNPPPGEGSFERSSLESSQEPHAVNAERPSTLPVAADKESTNVCHEAEWLPGKTEKLLEPDANVQEGYYQYRRFREDSYNSLQDLSENTPVVPSQDRSAQQFEDEVGENRCPDDPLYTGEDHGNPDRSAQQFENEVEEYWSPDDPLYTGMKHGNPDRSAQQFEDDVEENRCPDEPLYTGEDHGNPDRSAQQFEDEVEENWCPEYPLYTGVKHGNPDRSAQQIQDEVEENWSPDDPPYTGEDHGNPGYQSEQTTDERDPQKTQQEPQTSYDQESPECLWKPAAAPDTDTAHTSHADDAVFGDCKTSEYKGEYKEGFVSLDTPEEEYEIVCKLEIGGGLKDKESLGPSVWTDHAPAEHVRDPLADTLVCEKDLPGNAESSAPPQAADTASPGDICAAGTDSLVNVEREDPGVWADSPVRPDYPEGERAGDICNPEPDLIGDDNPDLDVHTESSAPAGDTGHLYAAEEVCNPEADVHEGADPQDLPVIAAGPSSAKATSHVDKRDVHEAEGWDLVDDLDLPVSTENAASDDVLSKANGRNVRAPDKEGDLGVGTESPTPVGVTSDMHAGDDRNTQTDIPGRDEEPECPAPADDTDAVSSSDVREPKDPEPSGDADNIHVSKCALQRKLGQDADSVDWVSVDNVRPRYGFVPGEASFNTKENQGSSVGFDHSGS